MAMPMPMPMPPSIGDFFFSIACTNCADNCPDNCYVSSPPPPPPPSYPDPTEVNIQHKNTLLPNFLIAAGSLIALSFLLFLISYIILRRRRSRRQTAPSLPAPEPDTDDGAVTHHVWLIRTVGLDEATIGSIYSFPYKSRVGSGRGGGDCTVCLAEFKDGEAVKLLPNCAHSFHVSCIDTWLRSHVNCPLCRAPVLLAPEEADDRVSSSDVEVESGESSSVLNEGMFQPVRRSVSMDASSLAALLEKAEKSAEKNGEERTVEIELAVFRKEKRGVVGMKRSLSTRSGRIFFPRYGRGRSLALPL